MPLTAPFNDMENDLVIVDDIDLSDESELRRIVAEVEAMLGTPGKGLRVSVLSAEQWQTVLTRWLPAARRRGAAYHTHALRDPRDSMHLVVSPSGVRGINEKSPNMYEELIYWLLRCLPSPLPKGALQSGTNDVIAEICGRKVDMILYARHAPREAALVRGLIAVLCHEYGHRSDDWALLLRRNPDKFFLALRKTKFCAFWLQCAKQNREVWKSLGGDSDKRAALVGMLRDESFSIASPFARMTEDAISNYLDRQAGASK